MKQHIENDKCVFNISVALHLNNKQQRRIARKYINMTIIGKEECNVLSSEGEFIDNPEVTPEQYKILENAHFHMNKGYRLLIKTTIDPLTGELNFSL